MENYVEHNVSITVHVRNNEWEEVEDWVWNNWDEIVAVSFIPYEDAFYQLMPYEEITKEQYEELLSKTPSFKYSILQEFETGEEFEVSSDCDTGVCPIK
jgi:ribonucleoside-diphosphate reductase alpha chain/ribonucleoside-triphosphate reductase